MEITFFLPFSDSPGTVSWKLLFELSTALRLVETDFLANGNHILSIFQIIVPVIALSGLV